MRKLLISIPARASLSVLLLASLLVIVAIFLHPGVAYSEEFYSVLRTWGSPTDSEGLEIRASGIAVDSSGNVFVTDSDNHRVQKFSSSGTLLTTWGSKGGLNGQFNRPTGITVDTSGNVYVADSRNDRIQKFTGLGGFISVIGSPGTGTGQLNHPEDIAVDSSGNVYVVDSNNHRVQKFSSSGTLLTTWGTRGTGPGEFRNPEGIAVDSSGNIYVSDSDNNRIQKFNNTGGFITAWGNDGNRQGDFHEPEGIAVDSSGNVYVVDSDNNRIQKFNNTGGFITAWGSSGTSIGQLSNPDSVAVHSSGSVFVTDLLYRIQVFVSSDSGPIVPGRPNTPFIIVLQLDDGRYTVSGNATGAMVTSIRIEPHQFVVMELDGKEGLVQAELPADMISGIYRVVANNQEIPFRQSPSSSNSTIIEFSVPSNTQAVEIFGTAVIPEFGVVFLILISASLFSAIIIWGKLGERVRGTRRGSNYIF